MSKIEVYQQSMLKYGIVTILYVMLDHELCENYEECAIIKKSIDDLNQRFTKTPKLPTTLTGLNVKSFLNETSRSFNHTPYIGTFTADSFFVNVDYYIECVKKEIDKIK